MTRATANRRESERMASKKRIPVAILGATGAVGQRFVQLLENHPWFHVVAVAASERSEGKRYAEACTWKLPGEIPEDTRDLIVRSLKPSDLGREDIRLAFSALPAGIARSVEPTFVRAGFAVSSNASAFRYEPDIPIILPDVNPDHLALIPGQRQRRSWPGALITNPNCTTSGIAVILKPLQEVFGLQRVVVSTLQAVSGAGYPGIPSLDILGNVVPYIPGEEEKIEKEAALLLGAVDDHCQKPAGFTVAAHANRVPVIDGHTICMSIEFESDRVAPEEVVKALTGFRGRGAVDNLPSAPRPAIRVLSEPDRPQPRFDCLAQGGMQVSVGRIRPCPVLDVRLVAVVHNTIRGAAGGSILNAELLAHEGWLG